ncbi:uncharacterized protein LOC128217309 [Mya arenaria]|uniref:uncharacterized protein LOC128217309 n=1 Tax=Mya arenaria TaxID=6604 RepID=UPI0022E7AF66|nr:uncharacterized protein LOC128217309 [Mya arenaria]XP_052780342.1 uncharacterized protein LOC128217309 [Mya arenaria]XP_052780343.1 uncharacterized protein LOC128217309 [Mya arenaria]XP_052780344.1 uncharacterized protein LOC128217309 [Mya arenaria]XP_052780345.1 uncharacterized protein LOC128217309 [Mya arenaria]
MLPSNCHHGNKHVALLLFLLSFYTVESADYTLGFDSESSCTKTHFYEADDVFKASVRGNVHAKHCPLTFVQSGAFSSGSTYSEPCVCLCVKILEYTLDSCNVRLSYHDGLNDFAPSTFDCHKFPPILWCSSKNELKVSVSELSAYRGGNYAISLQIKPFCGSQDSLTTDSSIVVKPQKKGSSINQTALISGAIVGTISIVFVLGWIVYCYRYRHNNPEPSASTALHRSTRASTPNQQINRYAPVERKPQSSSQSGSDQGALTTPYRPQDVPHPVVEPRLYSPFQPPTQTQNPGFRPPQPGTQQVLYSDLDRGVPRGERWFLGDNARAPGFVSPTPGPRYGEEDQVYKYPQDGEMHTVPVDTRFVVYDFDYEPQPLERKYSAGKSRTLPANQSPVKDVDKIRPREITPLKETVRVLGPGIQPRIPPQIDSTTDHTSDNDSSFSETTEDDTTDDQTVQSNLRYAPPLGFYNPGGGFRQVDPNSRVYDPSNFQRIDNRSIQNPSNKTNPQSAQSDSLSAIRTDVDHVPEPPLRNESNRSFRTEPVQHPQRNAESSIALQKSFVNENEAKPTPTTESAREGPMPQVPSVPREIQRAGPRISPQRELPWPHGPPPPYSPAEKFVV